MTRTPQASFNQRRSLTEKERDQRRTAILDVAQPLFEHHGRSMAITEIARKAGYAVGSVYLVFPTKDDLLYACCERWLATAKPEASIPRVWAEALLLFGTAEISAEREHYVRMAEAARIGKLRMSVGEWLQTLALIARGPDPVAAKSSD